MQMPENKIGHKEQKQRKKNQIIPIKTRSKISHDKITNPNYIRLWLNSFNENLAPLNVYTLWA